MKCSKCGREIELKDSLVDRYEHGILIATWCLPCYKKTRIFRKATDYNSFDNYRTPKVRQMSPILENEREK